MGTHWIKKIIQYTWRPFIISYLKKERTFYYQGIRLIIKPGVFHPGFFFSSLLLVNFLSKKDLRSKDLLDLGSGSGLLSVYAAKNGAIVTASDISKLAVENTKINAFTNNVHLNIIQSDIFENLPETKFNYIIVNPPYYKKKPVTEPDYAWYCGEHLEYYQKLFKSLKNYLKDNGSLYMILSEDCDRTGIIEIAEINNFELKEIYKKKKGWEWNYVYEISNQ